MRGRVSCRSSSQRVLVGVALRLTECLTETLNLVEARPRVVRQNARARCRNAAAAGRHQDAASRAAAACRTEHQPFMDWPSIVGRQRGAPPARAGRALACGPLSERDRVQWGRLRVPPSPAALRLRRRLTSCDSARPRVERLLMRAMSTCIWNQPLSSAPATCSPSIDGREAPDRMRGTGRWCIREPLICRDQVDMGAITAFGPEAERYRELVSAGARPLVRAGEAERVSLPTAPGRAPTAARRQSPGRQAPAGPPR